MSARKKAPVNLLMCPFELYMFIGVSTQLRVVFKYDFLVLIPYCWSVALEKKKKKKKCQSPTTLLPASCTVYLALLNQQSTLTLVINFEPPPPPLLKFLGPPLITHIIIANYCNMSYK